MRPPPRSWPERSPRASGHGRTSLSGRKLLRTVRTLILDEIHALVSNRRGSHLALSVERLAALTNHPQQRIGLSATQKPMEEVARFLVGTKNLDEAGNAR